MNTSPTNKHNKPGYILMLTLLVISIAVVLITAIVRESFSYQHQVRVSQERARARLLVLSSLELALSKVSFIPPTKKGAEKSEAQEPTGRQQDKKEKKEKEEEVLEPLQEWLLKILPLINHWHTIELTGSADGLEGNISYYIACEQGKINLDELIKDMKKGEKESEDEEKKEKQPKKQQQQPAGGATPSKAGTAQNKQPEKEKKEAQKSLISTVDELFRKEKEISIKDALKQINMRVEDPTDLLKVPKFGVMKDAVFMTQESAKNPLFLMDLFTVQDDATKLNPWVLSNSVKTLLGFKEGKGAKIDRSFVSKLKPSMNWSKDWDDTLGKLYGKKYSALEKHITNLFSPKFDATGFSVVSYCKVGAVTQRIAALLALEEPSAQAPENSFIFRVVKLYWL